MKRILACMVLLAVLTAGLAGCSWGGASSDLEASGSCGENLTWRYDEATQTLTLEGSGEMDVPGYMWSDYPISSLVLPEGLTSISELAFYGNTEFTASLELPSTLKTIGSSAFNSCAIQGDIVIPDSVEVIEDYAFNHVSTATGLTLSSQLRTLGVDAFSDGESLAGELRLPEGLETIGSGAFCRCGKLTGSLVIPDSVTSIGTYAFAGCGFDGGLTLPASLTEIPDCCFTGCKGFTGDLTVPEGVTAIGYEAFESTGFNGTLTLPTTLETLGYMAFAYCSRLSGRVVIPEGITNLPDSIFEACSAIEQVELPQGLLYIGYSAFSDCSCLNTVPEFPDSLLVIGTRAFWNCWLMEGTPVLPDGLRSIGDAAFMNCQGLTGQLILPEQLEHIRSNAFWCCKGLTGSLDIPDSVTYVGEEAFEDCSLLERVSFGSGIESVGSKAFAGCDALQSVSFSGEIPYYISGEEGSFPQTLSIPASTMADRWRTAAGQSSGQTGSEAASAAEEPVWTWLDAINNVTFTGAGKYADLTLYTYWENAVLRINGTEFCATRYTGDANMVEPRLDFETPLPYKEGTISSLSFWNGSDGNSYLFGTLQLSDGTEEPLCLYGGWTASEEDIYLIEAERQVEAAEQAAAQVAE